MSGRLARRGAIANNAWYFNDIFVRSNSSPVGTPYYPTDGGPCNLVSHQLVQTGAYSGAMIASTSPDADVTVTGAFSSSNSIDALVRCTSARVPGTDCIILTVSASAWSFDEFVAGAWTPLASGTLFPALSGATVRLVAKGTTAEAYINGVLKSTKTVASRSPGVWFHGLRGNSAGNTHFNSLQVIGVGLPPDH